MSTKPLESLDHPHAMADTMSVRSSSSPARASRVAWTKQRQSKRTTVVVHLKKPLTHPEHMKHQTESPKTCPTLQDNGLPQSSALALGKIMEPFKTILKNLSNQFKLFRYYFPHISSRKNHPSEVRAKWLTHGWPCLNRQQHLFRVEAMKSCQNSRVEQPETTTCVTYKQQRQTHGHGRWFKTYGRFLG